MLTLRPHLDEDADHFTSMNRDPQKYLPAMLKYGMLKADTTNDDEQRSAEVSPSYVKVWYAKGRYHERRGNT
ncbi:hypothetical protein KDA_48710 [Dictyobacter alpinus]|uniref:Uncharacterized protein n=1 Tax=Dictyobacter alpinus TaxID=2014873 RepID=A0A402BDP8_9CHLR|nr:hypothetical protein KDA_48710 [Dictyobacter alpinus]